MHRPLVADDPSMAVATAALGPARRSPPDRRGSLATSTRTRGAVRTSFIAGTGSFAVEVADWARAAGHRVVGLVELFDDSRIGTRRHGLDVSGPDEVAPGAPVALGFGGSRRAGWELLTAATLVSVRRTRTSR